MSLTLAKLNFSIELECGGYNAQVLQNLTTHYMLW